MRKSTVFGSSLLVTIFIVIGGCSTPQAANGGSLAPDPLLGIIDEIDLVVSTGSLGYEPIPKLDRDAVERKIIDKCHESLHGARIQVTPSAEAQFLLTINHAWEMHKRDAVALLISLEIQVPAEPVGLRSLTSPPRKRTLAIWSVTRLELGTSSDAEIVILEAVDSALNDLVESRKVAMQPNR